MWPLLVALSGGLAVHMAHKHRQKTTRLAPPAGLHPPPHALGLPPPVHPQMHALGLPPGAMRPPMPRPPHLPPGLLTPQRLAIHGELMERCIDPQKLAKAAHIFGAEGLPHHAEALMGKATIVQQMMQGAGSIVERCRAGDQHTMAIAKAIGERAKAGDKKAQLSAFLINEYSKAHPKKQAA